MAALAMSQPLALTPTTPLKLAPSPRGTESIHPSKSAAADAAFLSPVSSAAQSLSDFVHQHYTGLFPAFSHYLIAMGVKVALLLRSDD